MGTQRCSRCHQQRELDAFVGKRGAFTSVCATCREETSDAISSAWALRKAFRELFLEAAA